MNCSAAETSPPTEARVSCQLLSRGPDVKLQNQDILLHSLLESILSDFKLDRFEKFSSYFHPRAKNPKDIGEKLRILLQNRYESPWQFSVFRVWKIHQPLAQKAIVDDCPENEGASIIAQYGYENQYIVWLQIMGQNELGRIILGIAPDKGKLYVTALRIQQWTQQGEDWEIWQKKAELAVKSAQVVPAFINFDVAQKLLKGEDLLFFPRQRQLQSERDAVINQKQLVKLFNDSLKVNSIAYIGSLLAKDGTGIMIREIVEKIESSSELMARCETRGQSMLKLGWLTPGASGLRCNYIFPGMNPEEDSQLGGFYLSPSDLKNLQKK